MLIMKSGKRQSAERKYQIRKSLENWEERKITRTCKYQKASRNQFLQQKSHERNNHLVSPLCKILLTILELRIVLTRQYKNFKDYVKKSKESLIIATNNSNSNKNTDIKPIMTRKQELDVKQTYEYFRQDCTREEREISREKLNLY